MCTRIHTHTDTHTYTLMRTHKHTHTHRHTHTYTHLLYSKEHSLVCKAVSSSACANAMLTPSKTNNTTANTFILISVKCLKLKNI